MYSVILYCSWKYEMQLCDSELPVLTNTFLLHLINNLKSWVHLLIVNNKKLILPIKLILNKNLQANYIS